MNTFQLGAIVLTAYYFLSCKAQSADNSYDVSVKDPYYKVDYPKVLFDNAHNNVHTSTGTYSPFVNLLKNDGCLVVGNKDDFSMELLEQYNLLVISNAKGKKDKSDPAFTDEECMVVEKWVSGGGSLLLIADHYPMGSSAQNISQRFGVTMSNGETSDSIHYQGNQKFKDELVFSRTNGLLMDNEISNGKDSSDRINTVFTFRGQCLSIPDSAIVLLKLSPSSLQSLPSGVIRKEGGKTYVAFDEPKSAFGYCQGLAVKHGKGRVVILGEAAMLTAQVDDKGNKFGMNVPGNENRQFALNIIHWLVGER